MSRYKVKRKEIVNYRVREYAYHYMVGTLIIGRNHPLYPKSVAYRDIRDLVYKVGSLHFSTMLGNTKRLKISKRFKNLNFRVILVASASTKVTKEEFRKRVLALRWELIQEYIKHKREENKDA